MRIIYTLTYISGDDVELREYDSTSSGLIKSFVDRFPTGDFFKTLQDLWDKDKKHFVC